MDKSACKTGGPLVKIRVVALLAIGRLDALRLHIPLKKRRLIKSAGPAPLSSSSLTSRRGRGGSIVNSLNSLGQKRVCARLNQQTSKGTYVNVALIRALGLLGPLRVTVGVLLLGQLDSGGLFRAWRDVNCALFPLLLLFLAAYFARAGGLLAGALGLAAVLLVQQEGERQSQGPRHHARCDFQVARRAETPPVKMGRA